jgi:ubiquinone/menaquinone biosynthesis C-methylase UbiE
VTGAVAEKNWDDYVACAETVARSPGFVDLRDRILRRAAPKPPEEILDLGSGTGLLTLPAAAIAARVWALDISPGMGQYLETKARSAGLENVEPVVASIISIPLVDASVDLVISNYCFHHLPDPEKMVALAEVERVLRPGGRVVVGDMMFGLRLGDERNREVVREKVRAMLSKGPAGAWRLARNGGRFLTRRWERPASAAWWRRALQEAGFVGVEIEVLPHEGGIASGHKPAA